MIDPLGVQFLSLEVEVQVAPLVAVESFSSKLVLGKAAQEPQP